MSRLPDHLTLPAIKISAQRLVCFDCGAETNAICNCGVAYVPKAVERVAAYDQANPGQSTRQAAADLGISKSEVSRARQSPVPSGTPDTTVIGRDGKSYPATQPPRTRPRGTNANPTIEQAPDVAVKMIGELYQKLNFAERSEVRDQMDRIDDEEDDGAEGS